MTESSNTCDSHGPDDRRNCAGYAIFELYLSTKSADGRFHDVVRHTADQDQTATVCSSVDPWHDAADLGPTTREQVGLDLFYQSGYTRGLPAMIPIAMLYGTPEDAAAQIAYVKRRGYPVSWIEMGEEPDGQFMLPEDYGALYLQFADALHRVDPALKLGGPVFEGVNEDIEVWPDADGRASWLGRFVQYLTAHGRLADLSFMSFEHYPYEPCTIQWSALYDEPALITHIVRTWRQDGLPPAIPLFVTEVNIAWSTGESFVDIFGALWLADYAGSFLTAGGSGLFYFHYLPGPLRGGCNQSFGTFGMFAVGPDYIIRQPTSQFFASQLLTSEWVQPGAGRHHLFSASSDVDRRRRPRPRHGLRAPSSRRPVVAPRRQQGPGERPSSPNCVRGRRTGRAARLQWPHLDRHVRERAVSMAREGHGGVRRSRRSRDPNAGQRVAGHVVRPASRLDQCHPWNARDVGRAGGFDTVTGWMANDELLTCFLLQADADGHVCHCPTAVMHRA